MSVTPSWARIEPSTNSTIEWTIDCGCMTTSIRSPGTPKSQCASMTSSPLFISVAESIVIFRPIRHVGCFNASLGLTVASWLREWPRNGPPDAVRTSRPNLARGPAVQALVDGVVLAVDGENLDAAAAGRVRHQGARHDQHFLVRERDGLAGLDRRQHRLERRCARRGAQHHVHVGPGGERDEPVRSRGRRSRHRSRRPGVAGSRPIGRTPSRSPAAGAPRTCSANSATLSPAARATTSRRSRCASTTDKALRPIDPVAPRMARRFTGGPYPAYFSST